MAFTFRIKIFLITLLVAVIGVLIPTVNSQFGFGGDSNYLYNPYQQQYPQQQQYQQPQQFSQRQPYAIAQPQPPSEPVRAGFSVKKGFYTLEWQVEGQAITIKASRAGTGFVGFAISPTGGMAGADIFIAGIDSNGMPFANDYHHEYMAGGVGSAVPDRTNNYQVISVYERDGRTTAIFQRLLDTQDPSEDIAIQNTVQNVLWSIGPPSRGLAYHGPDNRGLVKINLLNPPESFHQKSPLV